MIEYLIAGGLLFLLSLIVHDLLPLSRSAGVMTARVVCGVCPLLCAAGLVVAFVITEAWQLRWKTIAGIGVAVTVFACVGGRLLVGVWASFRHELLLRKEYSEQSDGSGRAPRPGAPPGSDVLPTDITLESRNAYDPNNR